MWAFKSRDFTLLLLKCSRVSVLLVLKAMVLYSSNLIFRVIPSAPYSSHSFLSYPGLSSLVLAL